MAGLAREWLRYVGGMIFRPNASTLSAPSSWLVDTLTGGKSAAGIVVNHHTAMTVPTVYACVRVISETVASLPLNMRRRLGDGNTEIAERHPLFPLIHARPNRWQTSYEWRVWNMSNVLLKGNSYNFIKRNGGGVVSDLIPLETEKVTPCWVGEDEDRRIGYQYYGDSGPFEILQDEMLHFRGMPDQDGLKGLSVLSYHRDTIGEAKAGQDLGARSMANGTKLSGIVKVPQPVDADIRRAIGDEWQRVYGGTTNANKVAVLGAEADFKPIQMTMADAQYVEQRKLSKQDILAIFGVSPIMISDHERATFNNSEHSDIHYSKHTITPRVTNLEQAMARDLLTEREQNRYFFKFNMNALLRGDFKTRTEGYRTMIETGVLSPNEARKLEDMNEREGGNVYLTPLNHRESGPDAQSLPELEQQSALPAPDDEEDEDDSEEEINGAARALLADAADRVITRDVKAMTTGARHLREKRSSAKVEKALDGCVAHYTKIFKAPLSVVAPNCCLDRLAGQHKERLVAAIAPAIEAGDDAADRLDELVAEWAAREKQEILNDAL